MDCKRRKKKALLLSSVSLLSFSFYPFRFSDCGVLLHGQYRSQIYRLSWFGVLVCRFVKLEGKQIDTQSLTLIPPDANALSQGSRRNVDFGFLEFWKVASSGCANISSMA